MLSLVNCITEEGMEVGPSGDAKEEERPKYVKPIQCDVAINVCGIEWEVESTDEQLNTTSETCETFYERSPIEISKT